MLIVRQTQSFKKDLVIAVKRGLDVKELFSVVDLLANGKSLEPKYHDHALKGRYVGLRECHIKPDWLLLYYKDNEEIELYLVRTGTHSDLF